VTGQHPESQRKVEMGPLLGERSRGEVCDYAARGEVVACRGQRRPHALLGLAHRLGGEADYRETRDAASGDVDLHFDHAGVRPDDRHGLRLGEHGPIRSRPRQRGEVTLAMGCDDYLRHH
jgi:hypothetical protein